MTTDSHRKRGREPGIPVPYLRAWRHKAFMTQAELAKVVGRSKATVSLIESGAPTSLTTIRLLAEALHISPEQLLNQDPSG